MEESVKKVTVTSLASLFPVDEVQKAAKRVEDAIADKRGELDRVRGFIADNNNLANLVHKLPEELSHDIMVPFGKAAFFPGRLIHTNEFLVLLGEGYYAERTSKQTVEILQRRGKSMDSQVDSLEAKIKDLEAEASFFNDTASQVAEVNKPRRKLQQDAPHLENATPNDDGEYEHMRATWDELEKEELAAESGNQSDENDESTGDIDEMSYQGHIDNNLQNSKDFRQSAPLGQTNDKIKRAELPEKQHRKEDITDQLNFASLGVQSTVREREKLVESIYPSEKIPFGSKEKPAQSTMTSKTEVPHQAAQRSFDSRKAFPGSIIEHAENIERSSREQSSASSQLKSIYANHEFDLQHRVLVFNLQNQFPDSKCKEDN
ncbi:hypothetical protein V8G54_023038 [Vigna mungo]|uniref:RNA polymerase II subunit 5-mediating protein homolog n=1 Tax=Vigna mungo TaxID=3915 RepID=A0AAQ3N3P9_VIGMU